MFIVRVGGVLSFASIFVVLRPMPAPFRVVFVVLIFLYRRRFALSRFVYLKVVCFLFERLQFGFDCPDRELLADFRRARCARGQHWYVHLGLWLVQLILRRKHSFSFKQIWRHL